MANKGKSDDTTVYVLRGLEAEKEKESKRLTDQYHLLKAMLGRASPVPSTIDLSAVKMVLDVAAGNCVWILDVANQPEIRDRIRGVKGLEGDVKLYACDIDLCKFPSQTALQESGVNSFQQDVTKAFPEHLRGKFDLVHMSVLVGALSVDQWKSSMQNLREVLKPGGQLLLVEWQAMIYPIDQKMPPLSWKYDTTKSKTPHWMNMYRSLIPDAFVKELDVVPDLTYRLPLFVSEASMEFIQQTPIIIPLGPSSEVLANPAYELIMAYITGLSNFSKAGVLYLMKNGRYPVVNPLMDTPFVDSDEVEQFLKYILERFDAEGAWSCWTEVVAKK